MIKLKISKPKAIDFRLLKVLLNLTHESLWLIYTLKICSEYQQWYAFFLNQHLKCLEEVHSGEDALESFFLCHFALQRPQGGLLSSDAQVYIMWPSHSSKSSRATWKFTKVKDQNKPFLPLNCASGVFCYSSWNYPSSSTVSTASHVLKLSPHTAAYPLWEQLKHA